MRFVIRGDRLVEKVEEPTRKPAFPSPMLSRMTSFESPVTGKTISSWRQRDADMEAAGAIDPRDIPRAAREKRQKMVERNARSTESE